jgi:hypothetical protein
MEKIGCHEDKKTGKPFVLTPDREQRIRGHRRRLGDKRTRGIEDTRKKRAKRSKMGDSRDQKTR